MKCPKCGKEAKLCEGEETTFLLKTFEGGGTRRWPSEVTFQVYIHFGCSEAKTPNFVFYVEKEGKE